MTWDSRRIVFAVFMMVLAGITGCGKSDRIATKPLPPVEDDSPGPTEDVSQPAAEIARDQHLDTDDRDVELTQPDMAAAEATSQPTTEDTPTEPTEPASEPIADSGEGSAEDVDGDTSTQTADQPKDSAEQVAAAPPAVRLFLPTTTGNLLVDLDIRIDDRPLNELFDERIDAVLAQARGDESEKLEWEAVLDLVREDPDQFGRNQPINRNQYREIIRRYDVNRNKVPDRDEVAKFLFRNSGFAGPFRLLGTDHYREMNRIDSLLFQAIDQDSDGSLDESELSAAAETLMRMDENSDRCINLAEAGITQPDNDPAWNRRRTNRRGEVAMDLEGYVDWTMVSYALDNNLGSNAPFGIENDLYAGMDTNGDGSISGEEAKLLRELPADLRLLVQFSDESAQPKIEIVSMPAKLEAEIGRTLVRDLDETAQTSMQGTAPGQRLDSISLFGGSLQLMARAIDIRNGQNQLPFNVFSMLDANGDGALDEDEIPDAAAETFPLEELDTDEDGKLTFREINQGRRDKLPIWSIQVRGRAAEFPDGVFVWLDRDRNLMLTEREILAAGERLRQNRPLPLKATDIPDSFVVQIARADPSQDNQTFRFLHQESGPPAALPRWALHMDTNRDGDISMREFLGTAEQFSELDRNGDGFVDAQEVLNDGD